MRLIFSTCSLAESDALVNKLLEERLIGCANLIPGVRSRYWWEGEICSDEEVVLLMETSSERTPAAMQRLRELHSYDVPKIIAIDPDSCDPDYRTWLLGAIGAR